MRLYYDSAGLYMAACTVVYPILCVLGWVLLGKASRKRLRAFLPWLVPSAISATLTTCGVLLIAFVTYAGRRDYALASVSYLLSLIGMAVNVFAFVRFWKLIANLPPGEANPPRTVGGPPQEGVWPPPPQG